MKQTPFIQELNELNCAVNNFSDAMKDRLAEKAAEGKRGWNGMSSNQLLGELRKKTAIANETDAVDIANISMFIHKALQEGR